MIHFYLDLDAASENIKIGEQKLHSLQAGSNWPVQNGHADATEVHVELKENQTISRKEFLKLN